MDARKREADFFVGWVEREHGLDGLNGYGTDFFWGMDGPLKRKGMGTDFLEGVLGVCADFFEGG